MSLLASFRSGRSLLESLEDDCSSSSNSNKKDQSDNESKLQEMHQLINNLEETAALLRSQLCEAEHQLLGLSNSRGRRGKIGRLIQWTSTFVRHILLFTIIWQLINIAILMVVCHFDPGVHRSAKILFGYYGLVVIQIVNTIGVVVAAGRVSRSVVAGETISVWFLSHCYVATVLSFTGFYILTYRLEPSSWVMTKIDDTQDVEYIMRLFVRFLHLSASTASLCGISDIAPDAWYNFISSTIQMLLSFIYFASILGQIVGSSKTPSILAASVSGKQWSKGSLPLQSTTKKEDEKKKEDGEFVKVIN